MASASELTWWIQISNSTKLRVGRLLKAHGLKGAIKLELYTDSPNERFVPGAVLELQVPEDSQWFGKTITVSELKWFNQSPVLFIEGVSDRNVAETLIKAILLIDQPLDASPEEPDAWYDHQLAGLKVIRDGHEIGSLIRVEHMPAQDLLIIKTENGEVLLPFVKAFVPKVDIAAGIIEITPPGGLFEEIEEADAN
ncbi:MAG: ribosome maturation factor RimM [Aquiluna sp.]|nr:ribosome maturation factor RimM [Aquiluna sp.]MCF8545290.1 ribosome maturation factor RimM [Aquiluna sp.]